MQTYEHLLTTDARWALTEGSRHFEGKSSVQEALRKIARRLDELQIPYAVAGGMALFLHGFRRFTEDVDIIVKRDDLKRIHDSLGGLGYLQPFAGSKNLRDTEFGVRIEFLVTGQFPGDGKPKSVRFPDPAAVAISQNDICYVNLPTLIELKLASGISDPNRLKDLADVQELIKLLYLPANLADDLDPYVQSEFIRLWNQVNTPVKRYIRMWSNKLLVVDATSIEEMEERLRNAADELAAMQRDGVTLDLAGGTSVDGAFLTTTDPDVARRYDMHPEDEFLDERD